MKNIIFERQFKLRYFEMSQFGEASPVTMLTMLEETAADHCQSINYGLYDLLREKIGWVLLSGYMQIDRYPVYGEKVTVRTWLSKYKGIRGYRENLIFDDRRKIIGRARGLWLFFDINRRRPIKIYNDIREKWSCNPEKSIDYDIHQKIKAVEEIKYRKKFMVRLFDMDSNRHVNNIKYLEWLLETIPAGILKDYYMYSIDGRFIRETAYGHTIESLTGHGETDNVFTHTIKDLDGGYVCVTAKTIWVKK
ncbi:MAG TPA: acyl-ACP thioesterase [Proteobacteria bacterium]|nr:acyl-ACP thioesterase [Pseudomonadota bacterium]